MAANRFRREERALARLHQTHIVPVFAAGEEAGLQYFAMQYIDGASLGHVVNALRDPKTLAADTTEFSLKELVKSLRQSKSQVPSVQPATTAPERSVRQAST